MDLTSIAPARKTVALGSAAAMVTGLSLRKLTRLIGEHPALLGFAGSGDIDIASLVVSGPDMALAIFAEGLIGPAKPRGLWRSSLDGSAPLAAFESAPAGQQIDALATIYDLTFRGERAAPFLRNVIGLLVAGQKSAAVETATPVTSAASMPESPSD